MCQMLCGEEFINKKIRKRRRRKGTRLKRRKKDKCFMKSGTFSVSLVPNTMAEI